MIKNIKLKRIFYLLLIILLTFSLSKSIYSALHSSADFMWHPTKMLFDGINHYRYFINGGERFLSQGGEYGHGLYVILFPFSFLEWENAKIIWIIINIFLCFSIPILICKTAKLSKHQTFIICVIFATCAPTRMLLNYGQHTLLIMFFLILPFIKNKKIYVLLSGFSYFKYSIGYALLFYYLVKKKFVELFLSGVPAIIAWIIYFKFTNSDPITNIFEPFILVFKNNFSMSGDLFSILNETAFTANQNINKIITVTMVLLVNFLFILKISKTKNNLQQLSYLCLVILIFSPHANYDYILLLPLLIKSFSEYKNRLSKFNIIIIIYYFYINKILKHLIQNDFIFQKLIFILFFTLLILNLYKNEISKRYLIKL